mgnify:FL=1
MALQPTYGYPDALMVLAPGAEWSMLDNYDYATISWYSVNIQQPTKEACDIEIARLNNDQPLIECKNQASKLLYQTDWTSIPDVADPAVSNPYLMNQSAFLAYRSQVRQLAVTPVANPVWPTMPTAQWSS